MYVDKMDRASSFKKDGNTEVQKQCVLLFSQHEEPSNDHKMIGCSVENNIKFIPLALILYGFQQQSIGL